MFKREQKQPGVVYLLCSVRKRVSRVYRMHKKQKKTTVSSFRWSSFLFSNLYIKRNVRSCQYSAFVSSCVSPVSFHQRQWRWCQDWMLFKFIFYLNINFIHHSQCHLNLIRACINIYFSMFSHTSFWSLYSVMLSSYCSRGRTNPPPCVFMFVFHSCWNSCTDY